MKTTTATKFTATVIDLNQIASLVFTAFVPCKKGLNDKKIPCKGAKGWQNGTITLDKLSDYPDMTMLSIVLGNEYIAIDKDGITAIEFFDLLGFELPETLTISSNPGQREALIYKIEKPFEHFTIATGDQEQLEFRTGKHYQVIAGIHPKTNQPYYSNHLPVATISKNHPIYSYLESNGKSEAKPEKQVSSALPDFRQDIPILEFFLTGSDRQLIINGAEQGSRNNSGYKLAVNLVGTENRLNQLGIKYQGAADELFEQYCQACNPSIDRSESETIWNSAFNSKPEPTLDDQELKELAQEWNSAFNLDQNLQKHQERKNLDKFQELQENVNRLKVKNFTSAELPIIAGLAFRQTFDREPGYRDQEMIQTIENMLSEVDYSEDQKVTFQSGLSDIQKAQTSKLSADYVLSGTSILKDLKRYGVENNIPEEYLIMSLLTCSSSVISKFTNFNFNSTGICSSNIFTIFLGGSTDGKSLAVDPFKKSFKRLAVEANNTYIQDNKAYNAFSEYWKTLKKDEKEAQYLQQTYQSSIPDDMDMVKIREVMCPTPTKAHPYIVTDSSLQAISTMSGEHKNYGLLISPDEVTDFLSGIDTINNNKKGNALDQFIRIWNGDTTLRNRVSTSEEEADFFRCSMLSTIQTKRFYNTFDIDNNVGSGICGRFLYVPIAEPIVVPNKFLEDIQTNFDFPEICLNLYKKIQNASHVVDPVKGEPVNTLVKNTKTSHAIWAAFRNQTLEKSRNVIDTNEAFGQWLNRIPEQVARIALTLHCLRIAEGVDKDLQHMSDETMLRACAIGMWLIEKASLVYKHSLTDKLENIDQSKLFLFQEFIKKCKKILENKQKQFIEASDFYKDAFCRKAQVLREYGNKDKKYLRKPEILELFLDVAKHGLAEFDQVNGLLKL